MATRTFEKHFKTEAEAKAAARRIPLEYSRPGYSEAYLASGPIHVSYSNGTDVWAIIIEEYYG